jgi:hypothetical protein
MEKFIKNETTANLYTLNILLNSRLAAYKTEVYELRCLLDSKCIDSNAIKSQELIYSEISLKLSRYGFI